MMKEDQSAIDFLKEFANNSHRQIKYNIQPYTPGAFSKILYYKRTVIIPNTENSSYFLCYADTKDLSPTGTFSGIFIPIQASEFTHLQFRQKDILDKINPFLKNKELIIGNKQFDDKIVITGTDDDNTLQIFKHAIIQELVTKALNLDVGIHFAINELNLNFAPPFKGKSHLGIYKKQRWILDANHIEELFALVEVLKRMN